MRIVYGGSETGTTEVDGQNLRESRALAKVQQKQLRKPDRNVRRINGERIHFRDLAIVAWPQKAEANLSFLTGYDARTCRRWLAGDTEPPAEALGVILAEIMRRFHQR